MDLTPEQRYSRHLSLKHIGAIGQNKLKDASVLIVGLGGLGSPAALYLAGAGIGRLVFNDFDVVSTSNLHRQIVHQSNSIGELKSTSAKRQCLALNDDCLIDTIDHAMEYEELLTAVSKSSVVLDCSDNLETRFEINRACQTVRVPLVVGAAIRFDGQLMVVDPRDKSQENSACYRCLYPHDANVNTADDCAQAGVLGPVVGMIGVTQALEAIKIIIGVGDCMAGQLRLFNGLRSEWTAIEVNKANQCPHCS